MIIRISESIRRVIAEKAAEQARSAYRYDEWFVVNGEAVAHKECNAPAAPWAAADHVIAVGQLMKHYAVSLDGSAVACVPDCYDATQYEAWIA